MSAPSCAKTVLSEAAAALARLIEPAYEWLSVWTSHVGASGSQPGVRCLET